MNRKTLFLLTVAAALASVFGVIGYASLPASTPEPTLQQALFIQPDPLQMHLYPTQENPQPGDRLKSYDVLTDGVTTTSFITYADLSTEDQHFFPGGMHVCNSEDYFAAVQGQRGRLLRGISFFEPDGETYKSHKVYRNPSGYLERAGQRMRDGRYQQRYYFEDGASVARIRYFDSGLNFSTEDIYRWKKDHDGLFVYAKMFRADFAGQFWISIYREDGTLSAVLKHAAGQEEGRIYEPDGIIVSAEFGTELAGSHSYFLGYTPGVEEPTTLWNSLMGRTTVTVVDPVSHLVVLQQVWKERPDQSLPGGKRYLLMTASKYDPFEQTVLKVQMSDSGSKPTAVTIENKDGHTLKSVDSSELSREESARHVVTSDKTAKVGKQREADQKLSPADADERYVEIPRGLLTMPERPQLVEFDDFGPPHLYDYR